MALDNDLETWTSFDNQYWPAHYLIDKTGKVVYTHFGEGHYDVTEHNIQVLLGITGSVTSYNKDTTLEESSGHQTPETYLGSSRAARFSNGKKAAKPDTEIRYQFPSFIPSDHWALNGTWKMDGEKITASKDAQLRINFTAKKVFLVLGNPSGKPLHALITLNGKPVGTSAGKDAPQGMLTIDKHTLYELINQPRSTNGLLEIKVQDPGLEAYAFTFG